MFALWVLSFLMPFSVAQAEIQVRPSLDFDFADPMVLKASDGYFYAYATGTSLKTRTLHIAVSRSKDLKHWSQPSEALPRRPKWADRVANYWAPHAIERGGKYYLFYSAQPNWSREEKMRLAVAVSERPEGPFVDTGAAIDTGDAEENIDAMVFEDPATQKVFLFWGRNGVIVAQELASDLKSFKKGSEPTEILKARPGRDYEGIVEAPYVVFQDGYYYLFTSGDDCCDKAHYATFVARSESPLGSYKRAPSIFMKNYGRWIGTGHNAVFSDGEGHFYNAFHAVNPETLRAGEKPKRAFFLSPITFKNGWPRNVR